MNKDIYTCAKCSWCPKTSNIMAEVWGEFNLKQPKWIHILNVTDQCLTHDLFYYLQIEIKLNPSITMRLIEL